MIICVFLKGAILELRGNCENTECKNNVFLMESKNTCRFESVDCLVFQHHLLKKYLMN